MLREKPLVVHLCAARYHKLYPSWSILRSSVLLWENVSLCTFVTVLVLFCYRTDPLKWLMWRSNEFATSSASYSARRLQKHIACMTKHLVIMPKVKRKPTNGVSVSRNGGYRLMVKSVLDDLQLNHNWKCGKIMALKASSWRKFFNQDRRWIENFIVPF